MTSKRKSFLTQLKKQKIFNKFLKAAKVYYASNETLLLREQQNYSVDTKIYNIHHFDIEYKNVRIYSQLEDKITFNLLVECSSYFTVIDFGYPITLSSVNYCEFKCIGDYISSEVTDVDIIGIEDKKIKKSSSRKQDNLNGLNLDNAEIDSSINSGEFLKSFVDRRFSIKKIINDISHLNIYDSLNYLSDILDINQTELALRSGLSLKTIQRYLNPKMKRGNKNPEKKTVVSMLRAMNLPFEISNICLHKANINFMKNNVYDDALIYSLTDMKHVDTRFVNKFIDEVEKITKV